MRPGGPLESIAAFAGKLPDHGSRLAALLTIADRAGKHEPLLDDPIPGWAMESAERLIAAIATHVVKVTGDAGADQELLDLSYLLELAIEMHGRTQSDIREKARARKQFRNATYVSELFDELEKRYCVRRIHQPRNPGPGNNPSPIIEVHPTLLPSEESDLSESPERSDKSEADEPAGDPVNEILGVAT